MCFALFEALQAQAQMTPALNAVKLSDSLVFSSSAPITNASVAWDPVCQRYYSGRIGSGAFPLEAWPSTGGLSTFQTTTGLDLRGIWWNPNTQEMECNLMGALGWATIPVDASCNAVSMGSGNIFLTGSQ